MDGAIRAHPPTSALPTTRSLRCLKEKDAATTSLQSEQQKQAQSDEQTMELINSRREDDDIVMIEPDADAVDPEQKQAEIPTKPSKEKEPEPLTVPRVAATKVDLGWPNMEQATSATHAKLLEQQQRLDEMMDQIRCEKAAVKQVIESSLKQQEQPQPVTEDNRTLFGGHGADQLQLAVQKRIDAAKKRHMKERRELEELEMANANATDARERLWLKQTVENLSLDADRRVADLPREQPPTNNSAMKPSAVEPTLEEEEKARSDKILLSYRTGTRVDLSGDNIGRRRKKTEGGVWNLQDFLHDRIEEDLSGLKNVLEDRLAPPLSKAAIQSDKTSQLRWKATLIPVRDGAQWPRVILSMLTQWIMRINLHDYELGLSGTDAFDTVSELEIMFNELLLVYPRDVVMNVVHAYGRRVHAEEWRTDPIKAFVTSKAEFCSEATKMKNWKRSSWQSNRASQQQPAGGRTTGKHKPRGNDQGNQQPRKMRKLQQQRQVFGPPAAGSANNLIARSRDVSNRNEFVPEDKCAFWHNTGSCRSGISCTRDHGPRMTSAEREAARRSAGGQ